MAKCNQLTPLPFKELMAEFAGSISDNMKPQMNDYNYTSYTTSVFLVEACLRIVRATSSGPGVLSGSSHQPMARLLSSSSGKAGSPLNRPGNAQSPMSGQAAIGRCNGTVNSFRNIKVSHRAVSEWLGCMTAETCI